MTRGDEVTLLRNGRTWRAFFLRKGAVQPDLLVMRLAAPGESFHRSMKVGEILVPEDEEGITWRRGWSADNAAELRAIWNLRTEGEL